MGHWHRELCHGTLQSQGAVLEWQNPPAPRSCLDFRALSPSSSQGVPLLSVFAIKAVTSSTARFRWQPCGCPRSLPLFSALAQITAHFSLQQRVQTLFTWCKDPSSSSARHRGKEWPGKMMNSPEHLKLAPGQTQEPSRAWLLLHTPFLQAEGGLPDLVVLHRIYPTVAQRESLHHLNEDMRQDKDFCSLELSPREM